MLDELGEDCNVPTAALNHGLKLFSTCPPPGGLPARDYLRRVQDIAIWSEEAGYEGMLVSTADGLPDPWLISQTLIEATKRLCPLVAIEPAFMHPYSVAKMVSSIAYLYGRRVYLNMAADGSEDEAAFNDRADERYARLIEYATLTQSLMQSEEPLTFEGRHYCVMNLDFAPALTAGLKPILFVSSASESCIKAARQLGATAIMYPKPPSDHAPVAKNGTHGIRVGIIAREEDEEALRIARVRFRENCKPPLNSLSTKNVSSASSQQRLSGCPVGADSLYWLLPSQRGKTLPPYLVGSYDRVADEVARYVDAGYRTFLLDVPSSAEDMRHIGEVFERSVCAFAVG
jgi:alkanesulfonate monooxygenase